MHGNELPAELIELLGDGAASPDEEQIQGLTRLILEQRDEAVRGRQQSGIEQTWMDAEEAYLGIDDENRSEFEGAKWAKPNTMDGGLTRRSNSSDGIRATAFVRLTARYVDAGAAKLAEIALPADGKAFSLKPTPVPELAEALEDDSPVQVGGMAMQRPPEDGEEGPQPLTVADLAKHQQSVAEAKGKKAETRIYDWMVEYNHAAEMRKVIFDGARIGSGVLKGPIPEQRRAAKFAVVNGVGALTIVEKVAPAARWLDVWNLFPDPGCGENIHDGEYCFERDSMLPAKLKSLCKLKGQHWRRKEIEDCIAEGPEKCNDTNSGIKRKEDKPRTYTLWHYYGAIKRSEFALVNPDQATSVPEGNEYVWVVATLCNDKIIRCILNPLESGSFPYLVFNWRRRAGHWAGVGVAEQIRGPQRMVNAATRRLIDNAGKSAGTIIVGDPDGLVPAKGDRAENWLLTGGDNIFWRTKNAAAGAVKELFEFYQVPNVTPQLMQVVEYAFRLAEEQSSIPLITQGQSGDTTPDTFSGMQLQDNNANQLLRDVGFGLHDSITDPLVHRMYEWLLMDPDIPDDEKGDLQVDISGAVALIERALQRQLVMMMAGFLGRPGSRLDPAKWEESMLRMNRLVPSDFQYDDATWKKIQETPPPPPPQVMAAQIRAESAEKIAQSRDALAEEKINVDTDRDRVYNEVLAGREAANYDYNLRRLELERELALLKYANERQISVDDAKVALARDVMKLQAQKELAGADGKGPQVATPAVEPEGRAPEGQAFQK